MSVIERYVAMIIRDPFIHSKREVKGSAIKGILACKTCVLDSFLVNNSRQEVLPDAANFLEHPELLDAQIIPQHNQRFSNILIENSVERTS